MEDISEMTKCMILDQKTKSVSGAADHLNKIGVLLNSIVLM